MKKIFNRSLLIYLIVITWFFSPYTLMVANANSNDPNATGDPTRCTGKIIDFGVTKKLLPITPGGGRDGTCVTPNIIVMHITETGYTTADQTYTDFANNSNGQMVASHFVIGRAGDTLQLVETLDKTVEYAQAVGGYGNDISIELTAPKVLNSKNDLPAAEYNAALTLVQKLMKQYNIPLGPHDYTWEDTANPNGDSSLPAGVYGHYQLNPPPVRTDPGQGFMKDFRQDLGSGNGNGTANGNGNIVTSADSCGVVTKVGNPKGSPPSLSCGTASIGGDYALKLVLAVTNDSTCEVTNMAANGYSLPSTNYNSSSFKRVREGSACLDAIDAKAVADGLTDWSAIKTDGNYLGDRPGGYLQCVGFANAVLRGGNGVALVPEHNAGDYASNTAEYKDYQWYDNTVANVGNLKPGDAVIFSGGSFGHIAIAVKVSAPPSGSSIARFIVAEGNGLGSGEVDLAPYDTGIYDKGLSLVGWFHKK
jgi:hypothetical protein